MTRIIRTLTTFFAGIVVLAIVLATASCEEPPRLRPLPQDATILAFGDSLTYGTGAERDQAYPAVLASLTGREVINAGIPGEISAKGLKRLPALIEKYQPQLIILCHGGNDILRGLNRSQMVANITAMIELARSSNIDVYLVGVPNYGIFLSAAKEYAQIAKATGTPIENDILSEVLSKNGYKSDQIHPNAAGYAMFARGIYAGLIESGAI